MAFHDLEAQPIGFNRSCPKNAAFGYSLDMPCDRFRVKALLELAKMQIARSGLQEVREVWGYLRLLFFAFRDFGAFVKLLIGGKPRW